MHRSNLPQYSSDIINAINDEDIVPTSAEISVEDTAPEDADDKDED